MSDQLSGIFAASAYGMIISNKEGQVLNKIASYLQEHVDGEILFSKSALKYFSTDASILEITPSMVVYAANTNDIRKTARFAWQLAEKGHKLPLTARGHGTDQMGAAIGSGAIITFPAHMNRILEIDTKQRLARIQPGVNFRRLQDVMHTHGLFLPPYPASYDYSSIGGAIANNTAGEKSLKYGSMKDWVEQLEIVLANGEVLQTGRVSKRELNRKKGLTTFEGDLYRQIDGIITDNEEVIAEHAKRQRTTKNSSGYNIADVKQRDGSFDLTPLFIGSQGTLGLVTEAIIKLAPYQPRTHLVVAEFDDLGAAHDAISELLNLEPSALEMVDKHLLEFVEKHHSRLLHGVLASEETPAIVLLIEFDDANVRTQAKKSKKASKIIKKFTQHLQISDNFDEQQKLWAIRHSAAVVMNYTGDAKAALPFIEDGIVPRETFLQYLEGIYDLLKKHHLDAAVWGHAGDANLHIQPIMDLGKLGDRQKVFKLMNDYYSLVLSLGGSIAGEHNDGRLRAPFAAKQHGQEMTKVFAEIKQVFDPHNILNPGVKLGTDIKELVSMLRKEYTLTHLSDHLPRS